MDKYIFIFIVLFFIFLLRYLIYFDKYNKLDTLKDKINYTHHDIDSFTIIINILSNKRKKTFLDQQLFYRTCFLLSKSYSYYDSIVTIYNSEIDITFYKNTPFGVHKSLLPERYTKLVQ
jgi:hypothetical protein